MTLKSWTIASFIGICMGVFTRLICARLGVADWAAFLIVFPVIGLTLSAIVTIVRIEENDRERRS